MEKMNETIKTNSRSQQSIDMLVIDDHTCILLPWRQRRYQWRHKMDIGQRATVSLLEKSSSCTSLDYKIFGGYIVIYGFSAKSPLHQIKIALISRCAQRYYRKDMTLVAHPVKKCCHLPSVWHYTNVSSTQTQPNFHARDDCTATCQSIDQGRAKGLSRYCACCAEVSAAWRLPHPRVEKWCWRHGTEFSTLIYASPDLWKNRKERVGGQE